MLRVLLYVAVCSAASGLTCPRVTLVDAVLAIDALALITPLQLYPDFEVTVDIRPLAASPVDANSDFQSLFHVSSTTQFCCNYGDRILDVKFYPAATRLQIWIDSMDGPDPSHCGSFASSALPLNIWTKLQISVMGTLAEVFLDGLLVDTCRLGSRVHQENAKVYLGNLGTSYYRPAQAQITNLTYRSLQNQGSCWTGARSSTGVTTRPGATAS